MTEADENVDENTRVLQTAMEAELGPDGFIPMEQSATFVFDLESDTVERTGYVDGDRLVVLAVADAAREITSGDVVIIKALSSYGVRVYIAPSLLLTNRNGTNVMHDITRSPIPIEIVGRVVGKAVRQ